MSSKKDEVDIYLLDACIIVSILKGESDKIAEFIGKISLQGKLMINEINLYEVRYILKQNTVNKSVNIDSILDSFIEKLNISVYKNTSLDFKIASDIKSEGGLSPYDALMPAQITNNSHINYQLITSDREFEKPKFLENYNILIMYN